MKKVLSLLVVLMMVMAVLAGCSGGGSSAPEGSEGTGTADEGKVYELKMSTQLADTHPMVEGFRQLAARLSERTDGKLVMEVFPSAQLGSDEDVIEQAIQGVNVAVLTDGGRMAH
jgi:TRAP-type C4-dicarboxylate transport system substrate-binding protein